MEIPSDIILPPADVREIIDKTAGYIHRNGAGFEQRMKERQWENKQFQFLFDHDAYYGYYNWKLNSYKEGTSDEAGSAAAATTTASGDPSGSISTSNDNSLPVPRNLDFYCKLPPMSSFDFDVIKLTAMLVAQNDKDDTYVQKLLQRDEYVLEFLNEDHSLNQIFQKLVSQYKQVLKPSPELVKRVEEYAKDPYKVLEEAYKRLEYDYKVEKDSKDKLESLKRLLLEYASIDWQDFVVVETVEFDDADKVSELPLPISLADLQYRSLAQKKLHSLIEEAAPDMDMEVPQKQSQQQQQQQQQSVKLQELKLPSRPSRPVPKGMKIRPVDSTRSITSTHSSSTRMGEERMVRSPFSNQMIPESKLKQHIDISFRDPRYKEERARYELKVRGTNLNTDDVLQNIKNIFSKRGADSKDDDDDEGEGGESKKRKIQWDGYQRSAKYVTHELTKNVTDEMVEAQRKREIDEQNKIGPH